MGRDLVRAPGRSRDWHCLFADTRQPVTMEDVMVGDILASSRSGNNNNNNNNNSANKTRDSHNNPATDCVYVATDSASHPTTQRFRQVTESQGQARVVFYSDLALSEQCQRLSASIFDQAILARIPGRYLAAFISTWDEWVLHMRVNLHLLEQQDNDMVADDDDDAVTAAHQDLEVFWQKLGRYVATTPRKQRASTTFRFVPVKRT